MERLRQFEIVRKTAQAQRVQLEAMLNDSLAELERVLSSLEQAKDEKALAGARRGFADTKRRLQEILASFQETGRREKPSMEELG